MGQFRQNFINKFPGGKLILSFYKKLKFKVYYPYIKGKEALFTDYYTRKVWGNEESRSGMGSTMSYTEPLRKKLPELLQNLNIQKLLDAPCGDFNWFKTIREKVNVEYIGADIVQFLIENNKDRFGDSSTRFFHIDITKDKLPQADLWLCRDCWIHFSNRDIKLSLQQFSESEINYLLTTTHPGSSKNHNIATGEVRQLNLEAAPFNFPPPILYLDDWIEGYPEKKLALWKKEMIKKRISELTGAIK